MKKKSVGTQAGVGKKRRRLAADQTAMMKDESIVRRKLKSLFFNKKKTDIYFQNMGGLSKKKEKGQGPRRERKTLRGGSFRRREGEKELGG